ncbi:prolyl 3-hydroxylase 1-like [Polyodon spathula]|uniref:prolyl 3-hydroxylase 1-like n=1 Tax=Polyodon spathula TaxID=7913 RepID=UPI001B7DAA47|nr:prolyl 3-hydroxylase 1-like [Polyodon spathula]
MFKGSVRRVSANSTSCNRSVSHGGAESLGFLHSVDDTNPVERCRSLATISAARLITMFWFLGTLLLAVSQLPKSAADIQLNSNAPLEPYDLLYDNAIEAYYTGDWKSVILNMERALRNKGALRRAKAHCCLLCANQTGFGEPLPGLGMALPGMGPVEDLGFFQKVVKRAACIHECEMEKVGPASLHQVSEEVALEFRKRSPYNYLQVAYFKINKLEKAVAAANTFYIANPEHEEMRQNLEYYKMMAGVQESDFKDLEAKPHMEEFRQGVKLYSDDQFQPAIEPFERALEAYFSADLECRAICEGAYDYDGYNYLEYSADLFQAITDHYIQVLNCKQNCAVELATRPGRDKPIEDFLPAHFNYLQFAYYNNEKYEKAIECAKTYLLFRPNDDVMIQNLAYYSAVLGEQRAATITARENIQQYMKQSLLEKELLYFAYDIFGIAFVDPDTWTPEEIMPQRLRDKQKTERETAARISEEIGNLMKEIENLVEEKSKESNEITQLVREGGNVLFDGITVSMTSKELNGSQRAVLDGVGTEEECRELHHLSNAAALKGDGYRGTPSPHTPNEKFHGVTVLKALKLAQEGKVPLKSARLYHDLSEKVRKVLESYFRLETPLYFSYTHLVCRSAIDEKQEGREDLSHSVHVDNCLLNSEAMECIKETPAYTYRDYSAILYLNDDFEGGNLIFTELDAKTVTAEVRPKCGRVVGFGAGKENPHGVKAVTKGQRCAVAIWFTLDPRHNEKERIQAEELLKMLSSPVDAEFQGAAKESPAESKQTAKTPGNTQTDIKEETDSISEKQAPVTEVQTDSESGPVSDSSTINASVSSAETEQKVSESRDPTATTSSALDSRDRKEEL